ncbi:MAG: hypothetical protein A4E54_01622 [Pelotomaculum sp. PtaB.Bin117]|nr:MAG: hypothetical protein A4E54_01622 [Pelotomaculum sp. PtaB.Bin117]OPY60781.1 MAG: hypothetical protein A4E56_02465 [Pelotomaculum sp. PtaU1.Bin065]
MEAISDDSLSCAEANEDIGPAQDFLKGDANLVFLPNIFKLIFNVA